MIKTRKYEDPQKTAQYKGMSQGFLLNTAQVKEYQKRFESLETVKWTFASSLVIPKISSNKTNILPPSWFSLNET